jgi:hypothetical protein
MAKRFACCASNDLDHIVIDNDRLFDGSVSPLTILNPGVDFFMIVNEISWLKIESVSVSSISTFHALPARYDIDLRAPYWQEYPHLMVFHVGLHETHC